MDAIKPIACEETVENLNAPPDLLMSEKNSETKVEPVKILDEPTEVLSAEADEIKSRQILFQKRKNLFMKNITMDFSNYLLVWCPMEQVWPEYIIPILAKFDATVEIRHQWGPSPIDSRDIFRGLLAIFTKDDDGKSAIDAAAKELSYLVRSAMVLRLDRLIDFFAEAELRHPMSGIGSTQLYIAAQKAFPLVTDCEDFEKLLHLFGTPTQTVYHPEVQVDGTICEVAYNYATQAYAAYFYFDGLYRKPWKKHSAGIENTEYENDILKAVTMRLIDLRDESKIVPLY